MGDRERPAVKRPARRVHVLFGDEGGESDVTPWPWQGEAVIHLSAQETQYEELTLFSGALQNTRLFNAPRGCTYEVAFPLYLLL